VPEGAGGMGPSEVETARVSRSTTFGRAVLPAKKSEAERAGSIELAGGKILWCVSDGLPELQSSGNELGTGSPPLTLIGSSRPCGER
jgi:hypothetical protein